ncbi:MAG: M50 family metallopeptidase [Candidatus Levybacteria bacterium]|nr:M50 family metallopeptidase [Candidatus Levybacteria bacterium]MBP9815070.1 M50 family metallopeptidase [Candidatus Levybacteria bacterium]
MAILFFVELLILFFISQKTTQSISQFLYKITKSKRITIFFLAFLFLPGTIIHEFSHAIAAAITGVRVGRMDLMPEYIQGGLKLGSVQVGKADIVRNFFIGIAPFISGTILLLVIIYIVLSYSFFASFGITILSLYLVFVISNTMFSSRKDMEGAVEFFILIAVFLLAFYLLGLRFDTISLNFLSIFNHMFKIGSYYLLVPLGIDIFIITFTAIIFRSH